MRARATAGQLERRRRRAGHVWQQGSSQTTIAQTVGASRGSGWRWVRTYQAEGRSGWRARPVPGRSSSLSAGQQTHLAPVLLRGARAAGYRTELWTLKRMAKVIWKEVQVRYHPNALWPLLRGMGWSCQKPERRACQRAEGAIAHWRRYRWPHIKKGRAAGRALGFPG